jgi:opacity protein-like surface antigen
MSRRSNKPNNRSRFRSPVLLLAAGFIALGAFGGSAVAADLPGYNVLRGALKPRHMNWEGLYLGGTYAHSSFMTDYDENAAGVVLPQQTSTGSSYGGFIGYNMQFEDVLLGFEGAYNKATNLGNDAASGLSTASLSIRDYATFRARAGYIFGQFLPYAFVGGTVARADYTLTTAGIVTDTRENAYMGGFNAGLGIDIAILPNVFVRGEWEYTAFSGIADMRSSMNTARAGLGIRF